ncbi:UNVERIFIED_CONTAM: hypothetical protein Scaly_2078800 [Sesamum calycinum]|uniref:Reverse transcriptase domain-containing protein n=1 Tax=Sesamum calycinum TaxID=2727403 RepID=A0AAW2N5C8_9LAMI
MCIDVTDLNNACPKDPYPLLMIDRLVDSMDGCALLIMMDTSQGYYQIFMAEEGQEKTYSITEKGVYYYRIMFFGLKNGGATYQRLINKIFETLIGKMMEVYVDEIVVKSTRKTDHLIHLIECFDVVREYGMKLNPTKCMFRVKWGKFLGYLIT